MSELSESSLAAVVRNRTWKADDDETPLALFHKKFWGKSMKDEESEWHKSQISIDQDQDEIMDDDIISGCYVLDLGIPHGFAPLDPYAQPMAKLPSGVLTGQPGIGKSFWIYYAARRCAAEMKPFIWFYKSAYYLFVNEGVCRLPDNWQYDDFRYVVWTLVDSDQCKEGVPPKLIPHGSLFFVIYVTSPAKDRWSRLNKTTRRTVVIMNPWGRKEIKRAAKLPPFENITEGHIDEIFDLLGPVPRLCIDFTSDEVEEYKEVLNTALSGITVDQIENLITSALSMDAVSHKICLLSREQRDDVRSSAFVAPITPYIQSRLSARFQDLHRDEQIRLYKYIERVPVPNGFEFSHWQV